MKSIIVPIETVDSAKRFAEIALKIAAKFNSKITFIQAYNLVYTDNTINELTAVTPNSAVMNMDTQLEFMKRSLNNFVCNLPHAEQTSYATHIGLGTIEEVMQDLNEKESADLVIIRATDDNFLDSLMGWSNEKISRKSSCSVLIIPEDMRLVAIKNITLALDMDWLEKESQMAMLLNFIKAFGARLNILHIADREEDYSLKKDMIVNYGKSITDIDHSFHILYDYDEKSGIHHFLESNPTDILVLVYREHGFFKRLFNPGVRKNMISQAEIPLFVLK